MKQSSIEEEYPSCLLLSYMERSTTSQNIIIYNTLLTSAFLLFHHTTNKKKSKIIVWSFNHARLLTTPAIWWSPHQGNLWYGQILCIRCTRRRRRGKEDGWYVDDNTPNCTESKLHRPEGRRVLLTMLLTVARAQPILVFHLKGMGCVLITTARWWGLPVLGSAWSIHAFRCR